jgi:hypothetical protein
MLGPEVLARSSLGGALLQLRAYPLPGAAIVVRLIFALPVLC